MENNIGTTTTTTLLEQQQQLHNQQQQQEFFISLFLILLCSSIWGITNPFLKYTTTKMNSLKDLIFNFKEHWKFLLVQIINWSGSFCFLLTLSYTNLTTAVIGVNTLTCVITELTDIYLFHQKRNNKLQIYSGIGMIILGIVICSQPTTTTN
ncbi:hypothetical protein ABK040_007566 [Willaertia magna]